MEKDKVPTQVSSFMENKEVVTVMHEDFMVRIIIRNGVMHEGRVTPIKINNKGTINEELVLNNEATYHVALENKGMLKLIETINLINN